jgi:predicted nucleotidyltransferase component of viral defense system
VISDTRLRTLARETGVTAGLAEKNYVNSWLLSAIYTESLSDQLIFKGGTALSKLYFPEIWRFSEDLDFTATASIPDLSQRLETAVDDISARSGITFDVTSVHEAGDPVEYVQIKVQYDAIFDQRNTTELDITFNEPLVFPTADHHHSVEDVPAFQVTAYSVEEIFVEKLRSLYQRARARDYYDIYRLLNQESFDDDAIADALCEKSRAHDVDLDIANGIPSDDSEEVRLYWDRALDRFVREKPSFDDVRQRINDYLVELAEK